MNLTDKMAYLRGMVDGMELDLTTTKEGKVLGQLLDVMQEMTAYVTDLQTQVDELPEVCDLRIWAIWKTLSMMKMMTMTHTIPVTTTLMMTILTTTMMRHSMRQSARPATMSSH